jgi:hypothetical protein
MPKYYMKDSALELTNQSKKQGNLSLILGKSIYKTIFVDKEKDCIIQYQYNS